ncbi:hypothetical protein VTN31DRAFT_5457 [Thermomyces dupontii]|uniref:uncharacterized protein n=1 Tax=Talaromyces thermophilus TaxID=28565 RepID=UPI0037433EAD
MTGAIGRGAPDATALKIAEDFDRPDAQTRRDILRAILDRLQEHEWKQVVQRLEQLRSKYSYDIIGSLPLAVLLLVTEYLEPWDIVRSQRVSKRWRSVLSCDAVIKQALRSTLAFLELETEDVRAAASIFRWKRNLVTVRPFKKIFIPWLDVDE